MWSQLKILQHHDVVNAIINGEGDKLPPLHVQIEPTEVCNLRCRFCHWQDTSRRNTLSNFDFRGSRFLNLDRLLKLVDELKGCGVRAIAFTGAGDPCMYKGLDMVLKRVISHGIKFAVTSNFSMPLSSDLIQSLAHASWLRWSINASTPSVAKETLNPKKDISMIILKREDNIRRINEVRVGAGRYQVGASFVITDGNEVDILPAAIQSKKLGCSSISYRPDTLFEKTKIPAGYSTTVVEALMKACKFCDDSFTVFPNIERLNSSNLFSNDNDLICYYINHSTYIAANGDVYPCCYTRYDRKYVMGNIMNQDFKSFWFSEERKEFYKKIYYNACPPCHHGETNRVLQYLYERQTAADFFI